MIEKEVINCDHYLSADFTDGSWDKEDVGITKICFYEGGYVSFEVKGTALTVSYGMDGMPKTLPGLDDKYEFEDVYIDTYSFYDIRDFKSFRVTRSLVDSKDDVYSLELCFNVQEVFPFSSKKDIAKIVNSLTDFKSKYNV